MQKNLIKELEKLHLTIDNDSYIQLCKSPLILPPQLYEILKPFTVIEDSDVWPSTKWFIEFNPIEKEDTLFSFSTKLSISKLLPVFYLEHQFEVTVKGSFHDSFLYNPNLDGFSNQPYSKEQFDLHEQLSELLTKEGFKEINYAEASYVICSLTMPENQIFGEQVTVEYALFHDIKDLCMTKSPGLEDLFGE